MVRGPSKQLKVIIERSSILESSGAPESEKQASLREQEQRPDQGGQLLQQRARSRDSFDFPIEQDRKSEQSEDEDAHWSMEDGYRRRDSLPPIINRGKSP